MCFLGPLFFDVIVHYRTSRLWLVPRSPQYQCAFRFLKMLRSKNTSTLCREVCWTQQNTSIAWLKRFSEQSARKQSDVELNTLFVVQPREHQRLVNPFNEGDQALWLLGAFDDHVLLVQCEIFPDRVVVTANFDPRTIRHSDVREALDSFEPVCKQLASGIDQGKVHDIVRNVKPWLPSRPDPKQS